MKEYPRPIVVVSRCFEFDSCRWNGLMISSDVVRSLQRFVEMVSVCPEVALGLGVPRAPIRIVDQKGVRSLIQHETGRDLTAEMMRFSSGFLDSLGDVDGFILKDRSPSCGIRDVKIYPSIGKAGALHCNGTGIFAQSVVSRFGHLAVETEGRLSDPRLRRHFYTKLFTLAAFRLLKQEPSIKELVRFHAANKYLLMAYNQSVLRLMGRVVANHDNRPTSKVFDDYALLLSRALGKPPRVASIINALQHCFGYFRDNLNPQGKARFLESLERYREGRLHLSVLTALLYSWNIRYNDGYLEQQIFFHPFPEVLTERAGE